MNLINDPRLTAYALGEMSDAERAEFEALIANDAEALAEVEAIRAMATGLNGELKQELAASASRRKVRPTFRWRVLAAAASLVVMGLVAWSLTPSLNRAREVAHRTPDSQVGPASTSLEVRQKTLSSKLPAEDMKQSLPVPGRGLVDATNQLVTPATPALAQAEVKLQAGTNLADANRGYFSVGTLARSATVDGASGEYRRKSPFDANDSFLLPSDDTLRDSTLARERGGATDAAVESTLARQLPEFRFEGAPLVDAIETLRDSMNASIFVNWSAIEKEGIDKNTPVTLQAKNIPFSQLLQTVVDSADKQHRLTFTVTEGVIHVSTRHDIAELTPPTFNTESYARIYDNPFLDALSNPLSTFSVDVDTASYSNMRRFLNQNMLPPPDAVRIEELINYFPTHDAPPTDGRPFAVYSEVASCPWAPTHQLVRVALKGKEIANEQRPVSNLVFLIDVSGSMNSPDKLPLVKKSMQKLVDSLGEKDRVAIVVYAGASGLALTSTNALNKEQIRAAIDQLQPGGSTNGAQGIELAYAQAQSNFITGGTNRVILCTDGDFNVGVTDRGQLTRLIEEKAKAGVFLSVLGFGRGNTKDDTMEMLADKGNGNYAYIDSEREAEKVLVKEMSGTLVTIAKDVKLQLEFNPAKVKSYRLIGYENRMLAKEDFNNDLKDAGEIGAGHHVVALYEVEPNRPLSEDDRKRLSESATQLNAELDQVRKEVEALTAAVRAGTDDGKKLVELIRKQGDAERRLQAARTQLEPDQKPGQVLKSTPPPATDPLKYQTDPNLTEKSKSGELLTLKLRYKAPDAPLEQGTSQLIEFTLADSDRSIEQTSNDFQFASAVAGFGMLLRDSPHKGSATWDLVAKLADQGGGEDREGYQAEFRRLVGIARELKR